MTKIDMNKVREHRDNLYELLTAAKEWRDFNPAATPDLDIKIAKYTAEIAQLDQLLGQASAPINPAWLALENEPHGLLAINPDSYNVINIGPSPNEPTKRP